MPVPSRPWVPQFKDCQETFLKFYFFNKFNNIKFVRFVNIQKVWQFVKTAILLICTPFLKNHSLFFKASAGEIFFSLFTSRAFTAKYTAITAQNSPAYKYHGNAIFSPQATFATT